MAHHFGPPCKLQTQHNEQWQIQGSEKENGIFNRLSGGQAQRVQAYQGADHQAGERPVFTGAPTYVHTARNLHAQRVVRVEHP